MDIANLFSHYKISLSSLQEDLFQRFLLLFQDYNTHTNLSAIRDEQGIVLKHFIDSVILLQKVPLHWKVLDIGSGGGFPGIPLKIMQPGLDIILLDSVGKKVKAMQHFVQALWLTRIIAVQARAEILACDKHHRWSYDAVVSRATAYITDILTWATPFIKKDGQIILYKTPSEEEKKDSKSIAKKLWLVLIQEISYTLEWQERMLYIYKKLT